MEDVKVGLRGYGFMGTTHWGIYKGLKGVAVTALPDLDPAKLRGDVSKVVGNIGYAGTFTAEMIPFSRLPDLVLPDQALAEKTAAELKQLLGC